MNYEKALRKFYNVLERVLRTRGFQSEKIDLPDAELHVLHKPNSAAKAQIVLLHGIGASALQFFKILPALGKHFEVWAPHLPPFINPSRLKTPRTHLTAVEEANLLAPWLNQLASQKPIYLVGVSFGGWIALEYAIRFPNTVSRLGLINSTGIEKGLMEARDYFTKAKTDEEALNLLLKIYTKWRGLMSIWAPYFRVAWYHPSVQNLLYDTLRQSPIDGELHKLKMPVKIIWGEDDQLLHQDVARELHRLIPHSRLVFIPDCGHSPPIERPRESIRELLDL